MQRQFFIGNEVFNVPDELDNYNSLRHMFFEISKEVEKDFEKRYLKENKSVNDFRNKGKQQIYESLKIAVFPAIKRLLERGIYEVDMPTFLDKYSEGNINGESYYYLKIYEEFGKFLGELSDIENQAESEKEYREIRKNNRSQMQVFLAAISLLGFKSEILFPIDETLIDSIGPYLDIVISS